MCIVWLTCGLNYYLLFFLTNKVSAVYVVAITSSIAELLGYGLSGVFFDKFGTKWCMVGSFKQIAIRKLWNVLRRRNSLGTGRIGSLRHMVLLAIRPVCQVWRRLRLQRHVPG